MKKLTFIVNKCNHIVHWKTIQLHVILYGNYVIFYSFV